MTKTRRQNMILGALVADATTMGLHWIYDQPHIRKIAPKNPEFTAPSAQNYAGVPAFFAHPGKPIGAQSQYGEQLMVMLRALAGTGGVYDVQSYTTAFRAHFGYGGTFTGYIDHATRDTLDNLRRTEDAAMARARAIPFDGPANVTTAMVGKALALMPQHKGDALLAAYEEAIRITHDDDATVAYGMKVLTQLQAMDPTYGASDQQMPAVSKLPPLVAALTGRDQDLPQAAASAVLVTNDHPRARDFGKICTAMLQAAVTTGEVDAVTLAARDAATPECDALLQDALERRDQDTDSVTKHFGMACDLNYGVPSVLHNVLTADDYSQAIRRNIYAGGDNCGRSILLGALMGVLHGVPEAWIAKLGHRAEVEALMAQALL